MNGPITWVTIDCPRCDHINKLAAQALFLEVDRRSRRADEVGGVVTWVCESCLDLVSRTLQGAAVTWLVAAQVSIVDEPSLEPVEPLPPSAASAPTWTYDDLLDLHELLDGGWLDAILTGSTALKTKGFRGPSGPSSHAP